ncbi:hypothetical protein BD324DRAFT_680033 [Kockovaella imperatae]|uniref:Uncharacterized protein n=1 Tax=Kockovaella imperatae TaxID=4999 RepID=A0A1Y1UJW8_9TREE|nr:hypothetical protein BD324DRAFT_680033 [Kockovaella imperatae]ORX38282.1 hypothetical protein BD324DRAFT_680033 [Kockovaella imperatae]
MSRALRLHKGRIVSISPEPCTSASEPPIILQIVSRATSDSSDSDSDSQPGSPVLKVKRARLTSWGDAAQSSASSLTPLSPFQSPAMHLKIQSTGLPQMLPTPPATASSTTPHHDRPTPSDSCISHFASPLLVEVSGEPSIKSEWDEDKTDQDLISGLRLEVQELRKDKAIGQEEIASLRRQLNRPENPVANDKQASDDTFDLDLKSKGMLHMQQHFAHALFFSMVIASPIPSRPDALGDSLQAFIDELSSLASAVHPSGLTPSSFFEKAWMVLDQLQNAVSTLGPESIKLALEDYKAGRFDPMKLSYAKVEQSGPSSQAASMDVDGQVRETSGAHSTSTHEETQLLRAQLLKEKNEMCVMLNRDILREKIRADSANRSIASLNAQHEQDEARRIQLEDQLKTLNRQLMSSHGQILTLQSSLAKTRTGPAQLPQSTATSTHNVARLEIELESNKAALKTEIREKVKMEYQLTRETALKEELHSRCQAMFTEMGTLQSWLVFYEGWYRNAAERGAVPRFPDTQLNGQPLSQLQAQQHPAQHTNILLQQSQQLQHVGQQNRPDQQKETGPVSQSSTQHLRQPFVAGYSAHPPQRQQQQPPLLSHTTGDRSLPLSHHGPSREVVGSQDQPRPLPRQGLQASYLQPIAPEPGITQHATFSGAPSNQQTAFKAGVPSSELVSQSIMDHARQKAVQNAHLSRIMAVQEASRSASETPYQALGGIAAVPKPQVEPNGSAKERVSTSRHHQSTQVTSQYPESSKQTPDPAQSLVLNGGSDQGEGPTSVGSGYSAAGSGSLPNVGPIRPGAGAESQKPATTQQAFAKPSANQVHNIASSSNRVADSLAWLQHSP